jgi:hypothetical protein
VNNKLEMMQTGGHSLIKGTMGEKKKHTKKGCHGSLILGQDLNSAFSQYKI